MSIKTYDLTETERRQLFELLEASLQQRQPRLAMQHRRYFRNLFSNEHPVDQEIIGREAIINFLKERGFKGREFECLLQFCWGRPAVTWNGIIGGLNDFQLVENMLRVPNVGTVTVRSVLMRCIAHGWIRVPGARKNADRYLTETAPRVKDNG